MYPLDMSGYTADLRDQVQSFSQGCHIRPGGEATSLSQALPQIFRNIRMRQHLSHILCKQAEQFVLNRGGRCSSCPLIVTVPPHNRGTSRRYW